MAVQILIGDVRDKLVSLEPESIDCVVTSPPYWGLRDYGVDGQIGMEPTLGEHLAVMVEVFDLVRRAMKPQATLWLNYGDCYATKPNGRSAAATKAAGNDDRTFRDKPFSTVGPIYDPEWRSPETMAKRAGRKSNGEAHRDGDGVPHTGKIVAGGTLKPKDLCMIPNRLAIALQDAGWWVRSEIVWGKPNPMPDSSGRYRPSTAHEKIWLLSKSANSYYDSEAVRMPSVTGDLGPVDGWAKEGEPHEPIGCNAVRQVSGRVKSGPGGTRKRGVGPRHAAHAATNHLTLDNFPRGEGRLLRNCEPDLSAIVPPEVWAIPTAAFSEAHFATFPPALVVPCILAGCPKGGTVLDPFGGAGTTGLVADRLGRDAVLIELNPEYAEIARTRLRGELCRVASDAPEREHAAGPLFAGQAA